MIPKLFALVGFLSPLVYSKTAGELCRGTATLSKDGNWYCSKVTAITYKNISQPGKYNRTTQVNPNTGLCQHETISYSGVGTKTPLIGELSMHLRGPMNVSQLAVYKLPDVSISSPQSHRPRNVKAYRRSRYIHAVERNLRIDARRLGPRLEDKSKHWHHPSSEGCMSTSTVTTTVYVTGSLCDQIGSSSITEQLPVNITRTVYDTTTTHDTTTVHDATTIHDTTTVCERTFSSISTSLSRTELQPNSTSQRIPCTCQSTLETRVSSATNATTPRTKCLDATFLATNTNPTVPPKRSAQLSSLTEVFSSRVTANPVFEDGDYVSAEAASTWSRVAYYTSATPAAATGFSFLANLGDPQKSGTFDYAFGNSLSYVIGSGARVAANPTPFNGTLATSELEMAVFTNRSCGKSADCGYVRPGTVAYYGWEGPSKAFLIEFQMDHYNNSNTQYGAISDAPAWWFLNAAIPRILQYGNDRNNIPCACWSTGCGEFDAFEVLGRGEERAKSTIHRQGNLEGGDSNYFGRPVGRKMKFAVVFYAWNITARILPDNFVFSNTLTQAQINSIVAYDPKDSYHSLFPIGD